jgi:hypothetical protein
MAASGNNNFYHHIDRDEQLTNFLNQCVSLVSNESLRPGDIRGFNERISHNDNIKINPVLPCLVGVPTYLKHINPDVIIRLFFPNAQLPQAHLSLLKDTIFVFRSRTPLYTYQHRSGLRARYEIKMGLLGLFLLINYNITLRIFSVPEQDHIGQWQSLGERFLDKYTADGNLAPVDYDLQIIPPQGMDFSLLLELLPDIRDLWNAFNLSPVIRRDFNPLHDATHLLNLQQIIKNKLSNLVADVGQTIFQVYDRLTPASQSSEISELSQPDGDNEEEEKKQPEAVIATTETPEEKSVGIAHTFISHFKSKFPTIISINNNIVTMKSPLYSDECGEDNPKYNTLNTFYNLFFYTSLFALSKKQESLIGAAAQDTSFKDPESTPCNLLEIWLYRILSAASLNETHEFVESYMQRIIDMVQHHQLSGWHFKIDKSFSVSLNMFSQILHEKHITQLQQALNNDLEFEALNQLTNKFRYNTHTHDLLNRLYSQVPDRPVITGFIRKIADLNLKKQLDEFGITSSESNHDNDPHLRVRPATMILPGKCVIKTYSGNWQDSSGVFMMTGDSVAMAGYKNAAYSHRLIGEKSQIFGFPFRTECVLRPQGGKAYFSSRMMTVRIYITGLRAMGKLPDLSRKDFLQFYVTEYALSHPEKRMIIYAIINKECHMGELEHLRVYISAKFDMRFADLPHIETLIKNDVKKYYMDLFEDIVSEAIKCRVALMGTLNRRIKKSLETKKKYISQNLYNAKSNFSPQQVEQLAVAGKRYSLLSEQTIAASNEILLQGIRIINKNDSEPLIVKFHMQHFTIEERIQMVLQERHGNIQAIYANVNLADGKPNAKGITEAIKISNFIIDNFKQILPFAIYDEKSGIIKFLSPESFMQAYGISSPNIRAENANQNSLRPLNVAISSSISQLAQSANSSPLFTTSMSVTLPESMFKGSIATQAWTSNLRMLAAQINHSPRESYLNQMYYLKLNLKAGNTVTLKFWLYVTLVSNEDTYCTQVQCIIDHATLTKEGMHHNSLLWLWMRVMPVKDSLQEIFIKLLNEIQVTKRMGTPSNSFTLECKIQFDEIKIDNKWIQLATYVLSRPNYHHNPKDIIQTQGATVTTLPPLVYTSVPPITHATSLQSSTAVPANTSAKRSLSNSSSSSSSSTLTISSSSTATKAKKQKTSATSPVQVSQVGIFSPALAPPPASNSSSSNIPSANNSSSSSSTLHRLLLQYNHAQQKFSS